MSMSGTLRFFTRTKGSADGSRKLGAQDIVAYGYLLLGILIILVPVLWTVVSSIKPDEAIESFDTRILPYDQIVKDIPSVGEKAMYVWTDEDGNTSEVFKAGPTRTLTDVASPDTPDDIFKVPRKQLTPAEENSGSH